MNKVKFTVLFMLFFTNGIAQQFNTSLWCHRNVYDPVTSGIDRKECIDATFKYHNPNGNTCTGVLINRNTGDANVGFYFLTARHCFYENNQMTPLFEFGDPFDFYFNYQSKDANNSAVPFSNQGAWQGFQSEDIADNGYHYHHSSQIQIISAFAWGDMMLCKILTPLPTHFNITYSGWNPNPFRFGGLTWGEFVGIHHPSGDIKKISQTPII